MMSTRTSSSPTRPDSPSGLLGRGHTPRPLFSCHSRREERGKGDGSGGVLLPNFFRRIAMTLPLLRLAEIPDTAARENAERLYGVARALRARTGVPQSGLRLPPTRIYNEPLGG